MMDFDKWHETYSSFIDKTELPWMAEELARSIAKTIDVFYHGRNTKTCRFQLHALKGSAGALRQPKIINACDSIRSWIIESEELNNIFDYDKSTIYLFALLFEFEQACEIEGFELKIVGIIKEEFKSER